MATRKKEDLTEEIVEQMPEEEQMETATDAAAEDVAEDVAEDEAEDSQPEAEEKPVKKAAKKSTSKKAKAAEADDVAESEEDAEEKPKSKKKKKNAEPMDIEEEIRLKSSRNYFPGAKASKDIKKMLMSSEHVVTEDGDEEVDTYAKTRNREYLELLGSAKSGQILEGEITGIRQANPDNETSTILVDVSYGANTYKVTIPSYLLYYYEESAYATAEGARNLKQAIKKRLGSKIRFCASYVDQASGICYADRLKALDITGTRHYLKPWKGTDDPHVFPGIIVKSRVVAVSRTYVIVDALGAEITIPNEELSYMKIGDARTKFSVDQSVNVKILTVSEMNIKRNKDHYRLVKATGSIRQAYPDLRAQHYSQYDVGRLVTGRITWIDDSSNVFCELNGGEIDCVCDWPQFGPSPVVGQKRVIRITSRDDNKLFLYGRFVSP
ncbi:MAG: S1 RNA-binding domain-containing protein [Lachnospiraceae bacterium]|nr:S1 RNA-binding domain-containing protein [Lachnospiraceae bacterium]